MAGKVKADRVVARRKKRCARTMADEQVRVIGGRRYVRDGGEVEVGFWQKWILVDLNVSKEGWSNYKLFRDVVQARKRLYKISIKDGRLSKGMDHNLLEKHHPKAMSWVKSKIVWNEMVKGSNSGR